AARVADARLVAARAVPYEIQRDPAALAPLLTQLAGDLDARPADAHAVTMTAELSQLFRTKREGVGFVLDAVAAAFPAACVRVWGVDARWRTPAEARREPMAVAAANWAATARLVGRLIPDCLLVDVGSTTTDVIPIVGGAPATTSRTDLDRLREGELVYTGAVRTPVEAIAPTVPVRGRAVAVSAEGFGLSGAVPLGRGGRRRRGRACLARGGRAAFLAGAAPTLAGLQVVHLADTLGSAARHAPAAAVALLFPS